MIYTPDTGGKKIYCGPFAIAALTGESIDKVYKIIRRVREESCGGSAKDQTGRNLPIKSMYTYEAVKVLARLGLRGEVGTFKGNLRAFCKDRGHLGRYLVHVTNHFVVVSRGMIADNNTKQAIPIFFEDGSERYTRLGRKVHKFWRFK